MAQCDATENGYSTRSKDGHEHTTAGSRAGSRKTPPQPRSAPGLAIGETVILLHPPLPLVGVSIAMERERQQNDSLADGYPCLARQR